MLKQLQNIPRPFAVASRIKKRRDTCTTTSWDFLDFVVVHRRYFLSCAWRATSGVSSMGQPLENVKLLLTTRKAGVSRAYDNRRRKRDGPNK